MTGSGITSLLEQIYIKHTVPHILLSKAFARATRAHLIIAGVLSALLIANLCNNDFNLNVNSRNFASKFHKALNTSDKLASSASKMDYILIKK